MKKYYHFFLLLIFVVCSNLYGQGRSDLFKWLSSKQEITFKETSHDSMYTEAYEIMFEQPVDHNNSAGEKFKQQVYLYNIDKNKPVVIELDGYDVPPSRESELSEILNANYILVEHRYFAESIPAGKDWRYLNIKQAANDDHRIIEFFKEYYNGKWISTGISKGGQTTIYHRYFYNNDVDVSVPYVAPINLAKEDPRVYTFLNNVGDESCREVIKEFQRDALKKKNDIMPIILKKAKESGIEFAIDPEMAYEYAILEYSFAFWQWDDNCGNIPRPNSSPEKIADHLWDANFFILYDVKELKRLESFFYQAYTEIGYYGYDISDFKDLITEIKNPTNEIFAPKNAELNYDYSAMQKVYEWVQNEGNNFIFIYGEYDPWNSTSVQLNGTTNSIKMVKKTGSHATRIKHFNEEEKEIIFSTLEKWLDVKITR